MAVPELIDRKVWRWRRDRAALRAHQDGAEAPDFLLVRVMDDILERLAFVKRTFCEVGVLGAHHGLPGRMLREALPQAHVVEVEAASVLRGLCDGAVGSGDEEDLPFAPQSHDLIVAPLTLQFANDLPGALWQIQAALKPDGLFLGAITGGATLSELRQSFLQAESAVRGGASPRVLPTVDVRDLGGLLQRAGFALPVADSDTLIVTYATPLHLMRDLKAMGASNCLSERARTPVTRALLLAAVEADGQAFTDGEGRARATFEIITMTGWAPHPDQPRPLRPGSATHRLADALGTREQPAGDRVPPADRSDR